MKSHASTNPNAVKKTRPNAIKESRRNHLSPLDDLRKAKLFVTCLPRVEARKASIRFLTRAAERDTYKDPPLVCDAKLIQAELISWRNEYLAEYPAHLQNTGAWDGPTQWLADKTGINPRKIQGYLSAEYNFVRLEHADALMTVTNRTHKISREDGEIPVYKNPNWTNYQFRRYLRKQGLV